MGRKLLLALVVACSGGCVHTRGAGVVNPTADGEVQFSEVTITADLELEKLNDEELFATGTSFYAAEDFKQAARYFGRICDFFPNSKHRRLALFNAGLALEKLKLYEEAFARFAELSDPAKGVGDALDAAFRLAEVLYHMDRFDEARDILKTIADRTELGPDKRIEARVQQGVCEVSADKKDAGEATLRAALTYWQTQPDKDLVSDYFPAQAQFFLGEIYRLHYETIELDPSHTTAKLAEDLEYKSELLLSAQGHYLRAIRIGNGYWATASGQRIGGLYENMYDHMINASAPAELSDVEKSVYRAELRKKIRVLITKAITVYERTLEAAERIGASSPFVQQTQESLQRMKELLLAEAKAEEEHSPPPGRPGT
jgi:tetratricopeptide (TPR) repeat protein